MKKSLRFGLSLAIAQVIYLLNTALGVLGQENQPTTGGDIGIPAESAKLLGAALAIGLAGAGAGLGLGTTGAAAIGAISEKPEMFGKTLVFVVLVETIAIYGLLISLLLLFVF